MPVRMVVSERFQPPASPASSAGGQWGRIVPTKTTSRRTPPRKIGARTPPVTISPSASSPSSTSRSTPPLARSGEPLPTTRTQQIEELEDILSDLLQCCGAENEPASKRLNDSILLLREEVDEEIKRISRSNHMRLLDPTAIILREINASSPLGVQVPQLERAINGALMERAIERAKRPSFSSSTQQLLSSPDERLLSPDKRLLSPNNLSRIARKKLHEARAMQALANEGVSCQFVFLSADALRDETSADSMQRLQPMQEIQRDHPEWLHAETITLDEACERTFADTHIAVSHRWDNPLHPDPNGVQLKAIREHLRERPEVRRVWIDYCCMPQKTETNTRSDTDKQTFQLMLKNVNLLFLGIGVLILTDRSYLSRFWTQFEAWLAMQDVSASGLVSAHVADKRCTIRCVHGAPEALIESLVEEWSGCTAQRAFEKLSAPDVHVTNQSDKDLQLPKIVELDSRVSVAAQRLGIVPWANWQTRRLSRSLSSKV